MTIDKPLTVPEIPDDIDTLGAALRYANNGWYVIPVAHATKNPGSVVGGAWHTKSSRDPHVIASWFAGTNYGIALHVGRSGALILDVDTPEHLTPLITDAINTTCPPVQTTRAGDTARGHYLFTQPPGRTLGNGTGGLGGAWGEVRGLNGVIIVAPSVHPDHATNGLYTWAQTGVVPPLPNTLSEQLVDATPAMDAATDKAITDFLCTHTTATRPELLNGWVATYKRHVTAGESRHQRMVSVAAGALKEAAAGLMSATDVTMALHDAFVASVMAPAVGKQGATRDRSTAVDEWRGILAWAVAQAQAADTAETLTRTATKNPSLSAVIGTTPTTPPPPAAPNSRHLSVVTTPQPTTTPYATDGTAALAPTPDPTPSQEDYGPTEDGTARTLVARYGHQLRYCPQRGSWLAWDGARWVWDTAEHTRELVRTIARELPEGEGWKTHKRRALSAAGVTGVLRLAQSDPAVVVHLDQLDAHPYELNTPGGIVDMRTGTLRPPDPNALHTRTTAVTPDFDHPAHAFETFLAATFGEDNDLQSYVQRLLGVSAVGAVLEQILPFAHGVGANGKSTLVEAVMTALGRGPGGYAIAAPAEMLMVRRHSEHPAELAQLAGARLVVCSELEDGQKFAEARVKQLTGRDTINARFMRQNPFDFTPSHTFLLIGNHMPSMTAGGPAFERRIKFIPFAHVVPENARDPRLGEKLEAEAPAVLAWLIKGAAQYAEHGLGEPASVRRATAEYTHDQDTVGRFIEDTCHHVPGSTELRCQVATLRTAYAAWCSEVGETPATSKRFTQELRDRFGVESKQSNGKRSYYGIAPIGDTNEDGDRGW